MKIFIYPEHVLTCFAARELKRPVKWTSERTEAFLSDTQGRDNITIGELALDKDGRFLALRTKNWAGMGAYLNTFAPFIPTGAGTKVLASVYDFQAIHAQVIGVLTLTVPVDAYRGAGRPESNYLVERLIDAAAREIGIDRIELRRRNMVPSSRMPYVSAMGQRYDSGEFARLMDTALQKIDWAGFPARRAEAAKRGKKRGIGLAYYLEATGGAPTENAAVRFADDGFGDVYVGTQSTGQGHETAYAMMTSHELGIPIEKIRVRQGDSDTLPDGGGTGGARSLYSEGQAILVTTASVIEKGKVAASEHLEASVADIEFTPKDGSFAVIGTDRTVGILELAQIQRKKAVAGIEATLLDAEETAEIKSHTFPNGCHMAEVEVDTGTGKIEVLNYTAIVDCGTPINPNLARIQVEGGLVQGIGMALFEEVRRTTKGALLTNNLMHYNIPTRQDIHDVVVELTESYEPTGPYGAKSVAEIGIDTPPAAIANAICNAVGVRIRELPITPEKVLMALHSQGKNT
jgi:carbon-monoxide dehydrogenase large subunit